MVEFDGTRLTVVRQAAGLSQAGFARRCGLSPQYVSALERGRRPRPRPATIRKLANGLGVPMTALLVAESSVAAEAGHFDPHALATLRLLVGMSQAGLARRTGLSQGHISELERGAKEPQPETVGKLADGLGVPVTMLDSVTESLAENMQRLTLGLQLAVLSDGGRLADPRLRGAAEGLVSTLTGVGLVAGKGVRATTRVVRS